MTTHYVPYDSPPLGRGMARAWCGEVVERRRASSPTPTCRECLAAAYAPPLTSTAHDDPNAVIDLFAVDFDDLDFAPPGIEAAATLETPAPVPPPGTLIQFPTAADAVEALPTVAMLETSRRTITVTRTLVLQGQTLADEAVALQVVDRASCERGEVLYHELCEVEKAILADYEESCGNAYRTWKGLTDERAEQLNPVVAAKKVLGPNVAGWKADIERREAAEQRAREEAARQEQLDIAKRAAKQALQVGDVVTAAAIVEEAKVMPTPIVPRPASAAPTTGLTTTRKPWKATITDFPTLLLAIATQLDPATGDRNLTEFDEAIAGVVLPILNRQATTLKGELGKRYPGTEGHQRPSLAGR